MNHQAESLSNLFAYHLGKYQSVLASKVPTTLYEPCVYILSLGGKRVRPLLALAGCELFGTSPEIALDSGLAVELFHNFSLIHDDILDNAPLRRGQPTVHEKWGRDTAILSGDVMMVQSVRVLESYTPTLYFHLSQLLNKTATAVCEGQQLDMDFEKRTNVTVDEYIQMIAAKTAVLLGCSLQMGAMCAGANVSDQDRLYQFGVNVGIAFQLNDDLLDAFPGEGFGKQPGGDILADKKTFLLLKSLSLATNEELALLHACLNGEYSGKEKIEKVTSLYRQLGVDVLCSQLADSYTAKAFELLEGIEVPAANKLFLKAYAQQLLHRQV